MNKLTLIACFFALLVVAQARAPRKVVASPLPTPVPIPPYSSVLPNFLCQPPMINEEKTPDNVNKLRPHDIKAIMAMGDSITAGFAMHAEHIYDSITDLYEYRGDSYCIGGNAMQYTLGNYMTVFNPHLVGPAISVSEPISALEWKGKHLFPFNKASSRLNAAQSGAKVQDMPGQVSYLANELRTTYADQIDYDKDWKMITILIGANNMCIACKNDTDGTASYYKQQLNLTLTQIYQTIPRTFVNVLPMFNISQVYDWVQTSSYCKDMWRTLCESECPCQTGKATNQDRYLMDVAATQYREAIWELYNEWASFNLTTFKVAVQPFTSQLAILDLDFLSGFDCFHPSWISHAAMSMGLWNSMFTPLPQKPLNISIGIDFICPTKDMYLQ